jgi:GntR family transcriptional regulator, transcriptional repressor for pyruvate dehydrogenase complex
MLKPVRKSSLSDSVFEQLRDHIVAGEVEPGEVLPAERVLAEKLGVNRQAVREGLKRLAQAGLVDIRQGGATRVRDFRQTGGLELLASMVVTTSGINTAVARSVLEMRASLGPAMARTCASRRSDDVADALDDQVAVMRSVGDDLPALQELALRFWGEVVRGTRNLAYQLAYNSLDATYRQVMGHFTRLLEAELRAVDQYEALAAAIRARDEGAAAKAAEAIVAHGTAAIEDVLGALDALEEE